MSELDTRTTAFVKAVESGQTSDAVDALLVSLKVMVAEAADDAAAAPLARDVYEHAALYSLLKHDTDGFERHFALARCCYSDEGALKPSVRWNTIRGLFLMHLLVQNRLAEFHSELELLAETERAVPAIAFPLTLEQHLAEGRYNKVSEAIRGLPNPAFQVFVDPLVDAVRGEIATCSAASYKSLPVATAQSMLLFDSEDELLRYVRASQPTWTVANGELSFNVGAAQRKQVPSVKLITNTLAYASELERIV